VHLSSMGLRHFDEKRMISQPHVELKRQIEREAATSALASRFLAKLADRYIVDRQFGRGGMGLVYLARDAKLGRQVAIKVLRPDVANRINSDRFWSEIRLTATLQHPHILPVLDTGCLDDVYYCITPYLAEGSLRKPLLEGGAFLPERATSIALDVLEALEYAHERKVVHCDIKPENILLSNGHAILTDFGVARSMKRLSGKAYDESWGSPEYVSPEQASGDEQLDGRSDLYSLACVFYEMLAGSSLFQGSTTRAIVAQRFAGPAARLRQAPSSVPQEIVDTLQKALAVDPAERFQTAAALAAELAAVLPQDAPTMRSAAGVRDWWRNNGL